METKEIEVTISESFSKTTKIRIPKNVDSKEIDLYYPFKRQKHTIEELLEKGKQLAINAGRDDLVEEFEGWINNEVVVVEG